MNFFIVSAGEPGSDYIEDNFYEIIRSNEFALHEYTRQKGTYYSVESGDVVILKFWRSFVAYGVVTQRYSDESKEFALRIAVEEWIFYDRDNPARGIPRNGVQNATIAGGVYGTVKTVRPDFGLLKIRQINDAHPSFDDIIRKREEVEIDFSQKGDYFDLHEELFKHLLNKYQQDSQYTFVLRDSNNANALEKGYWFYGEQTVALSFWTGMDFIKGRPVISFLINPERHCRLVIQTDLQLDLKQYFEEDRSWAKELRGLQQRDTLFIKEYVNFEPSDYINCLDSFLSTDYHTINKILYEEYDFPGVKKIVVKDEEEFDELVLKLSLKEFNFRLNNLVKYRPDLTRNSINTESEIYSLNSITINDYALIKSQKIEIGNAKWVFITGENGSGKTMVLRAIATLLGNRTLTKNELENKITSIDAIFNSDDGIIPYKRKQNDSLQSKIAKLPLGLAMYGPYRLQQTSGLEKEEIFKKSLSKKGSFESLFGDAAKLLSLYKQLDLWNDSPKRNENLIKLRIMQILALLPKIIPDLRKVEYDPTNEKIELDYLIRSEGTEELMSLKWHELSSGNKSILNLVSDILIRLYHQQPRVIDPSELRGIVMIDEIDLHLHPKAQRDLVKTLSSTFPLIQFIVTTHSPIPLLGAPKDSIFIIIERDYKDGVKATKLDIDVSELLPNSILSSPIFDFETYININYDRTKRLRTENDYDDVLFYKILEKKIKEKSLRNNN